MSIIEEIAGILLEKGWKIGTAESCTGGRVACSITKHPGCSAWYVGSVVSYSNEVKQNILNVSAIDLETYGAVSKQVVEQMARGAIRVLGCDCAIATSGIAGPDGGSTEKPIGTIWIAAALKGKVFSTCYHFDGNRWENMENACENALQMLLKLLSC